MKQYFAFLTLALSFIITMSPNLSIAASRDTSNNYLTGWGVSVPSVQTIVDSSGNICVLDADNAKIYEFDASTEHFRTISLNMVLKRIGAFTRDVNGNYYVFYAQDAAEGAFNERNMVLVKYSSSGDLLNEYWRMAQTDYEDVGYAVMRPFMNGTCRMEISGDMIAVYFGKIAFKFTDGLNHQSSYGFILNKNTFERLGKWLTQEWDMYVYGVSHSFNQFMLPVEDGFVLVDQGDVSPTRAFVFEKVDGCVPHKRGKSFSFKGGEGSPVAYQYTFAEMGGLSRTSKGYIFLGASERNNVVWAERNDSRNLFVLTISDNLSSVSNSIWLTNYINMGTENAVAPKIVNIGNNQHLILWENYNTISKSARTYAMLIDDQGNIVSQARELIGTSLSGYDTLRYNSVTGLVHWAISKDNEIILFSLDPLRDAKPMSVVIHTQSSGDDSGGCNVSTGYILVMLLVVPFLRIKKRKFF